METADALKKSIGGAKFDSAKAIKNVVDVTSKANKLKKESIQIDKLKKDAMIKEAKALQELEKIEQLKIIAKKTVDIEGIGFYSLGNSRKNLNQSQIENYSNLFEEYFLKSFSSK